MLIMMPVGGGMVIALIITLCVYIGLMIANYFYYKKRMSLLLD